MAPQAPLTHALETPIPGILDLLGQSGPMAILVLGILAVLSIVSWGIMIERWRSFRLAEREDRVILEAIAGGSRLRAVADLAEQMPHSPLSTLLTAFREEVVRHEGKGLLSEEGTTLSHNPGHVDPRIRSLVERRLEKGALAETRRFQRFLGFLATTATVAPFIGLFGTVWGIMNAFRSIGAAGGASIAAYAPGIAEALVTTAAGLAAAIPAVAGYNYFVARTRHLDEQLDDFSADLLQRLDAPPS